MNITIEAIDFNQDGTPRNEKLHSAAQVYSEKEFGTKTNFAFYGRSWAVLATDPERSEYFQVIGLMGVRQVVDCGMFHVTPLTEDKEGMRLVHEARDAMIERARTYCEDALYLHGNAVMVYISPKAQRIWAGFLKRRKIDNAHRFSVTI